MSSSTKDPAYYRDKILALNHLDEKISGITKDAKFRRTYIGIPESDEVFEDAKDRSDLQNVAAFVVSSWNQATGDDQDPEPMDLAQISAKIGRSIKITSPRIIALLGGHEQPALRFKIGGSAPYPAFDDTEGGYFPGENMIWVSGKTPDPLEVVVHELQHALDDASSGGRYMDPRMTDMAMASAMGRDDEAFEIYTRLKHEVSARFAQLLLDILRKDHDPSAFKAQLPSMMKARDLAPEHLGSGQEGRKRWQKLVSKAAAYWVELQRLKNDPETLEKTAGTRAEVMANAAADDAFPSKAVANEAIDPDQIAAIQSMKDVAKAREAAMQLAFANARSPERRADLRDQIRQAGTVTQLVKLLWSMKLSNDGLKTGSQTVRTRKGVGYSMR